MKHTKTEIMGISDFDTLPGSDRLRSTEARSRPCRIFFAVRQKKSSHDPGALAECPEPAMQDFFRDPAPRAGVRDFFLAAKKNQVTSGAKKLVTRSPARHHS